MNLQLPARDEEYNRLLSDEYIRLVYSDPAPAMLFHTAGFRLVARWRLLATTYTRAYVESHIRESIASTVVEPGAREGKMGSALRALDTAPQILSLSSNPASVPMWYHYADQFQGVVIAFDCHTDPHTMFSVAEPVQYRKDVPVAYSLHEWVRVLTGQQVPSGLCRALYFTKSDQWAYEEEWRLAAGIGGPGTYQDLPLTASELGGLIIGPRTSSVDANRLRALAKAWNPHCFISTASVDYGEYGLRIDPQPFV